MIYHKTIVDSTQTIAKEYIMAGKISNEIDFFIAEEQTCGNGRNGKNWVSPKGNFYCSIVINQNHLEHNDILSLVIAIAVDRALNIDCIKYKWPNDLLIDNAKIAGILIEKLRDYAIIGIGINLISCPQISEYATDNLLRFKTYNITDLAIKISDETLKLNHLSNQEILGLWSNKNFDKNILNYT